MKNRTEITLTDLFHAPSEGFGYLAHPVRRPEQWATEADPYGVPRELDRLVVLVANDLEIALVVFQLFLDSKFARHMADELEAKGHVCVTRFAVIERYMRKFAEMPNK